MQRHIEEIKGKGILTAPDGTSREISYDLDVRQNMIRTPNMGDPNAMIGGLKEIRGRIAPVYFTGINGVTLQLQDGRKMRLLVTDSGGAVHASPIE
jgi:hypothetical protein